MQLGLNEREIKVYLTLFELTKSKAGMLAKILHLPKSSVIDTLYSLEAKGLVSKSTSKNSLIFIAESPEILLNHLEREKQQLEQKEKELKKVLPLILATSKKTKLPQIKYFEGQEGLIQLYEDTLTSKSRIYAYGSFDVEAEGLPGYFPEYYERRAKAGINLTGLIPDTELNRKVSKQTDKSQLRTTYLYPSKYSSPLEIDIYDDKVIFLSFTEQFGVQIESEIVAQAMRNIFHLARLSLGKGQEGK